MEYLLNLAIKGYIQQLGLSLSPPKWAPGEAALWVDEILSGGCFDWKRETNGTISIMVVRSATLNKKTK